ncbi:MAG: beta/gamma crystallin-related protein [Usitatibacteraceae bacterium]
MRLKLSAVPAFVASIFACTQAAAQITFYEHDYYNGRVFRANGSVQNFAYIGFNDRASSVIVDRGMWEVCDDANFRGRCVVLRRGNYESLNRLGINDKISSVRPLNPNNDYDRFAEPSPLPAYDYRRRPSERLIEVEITSSRAVMAQGNERCWTEHDHRSSSGERNAGGAIVGALIGGILAHQVGGGRGRDAATAAGALAGAAIGSNSGGGNDYGRDYERCRSTDYGRPAYWDVTYNFRGREFRAQLSYPPGRTITVNPSGEPRS